MILFNSYDINMFFILYVKINQFEFWIIYCRIFFKCDHVGPRYHCQEILCNDVKNTRIFCKVDRVYFLYLILNIDKMHIDLIVTFLM